MAVTRAVQLTRRSVLAAGAAAAVGTLAACASPAITKSGGVHFASGAYDGPPVKLAFWSGLTGADGPIVQQIIERFMKEHPNIVLSTYTLPWANLNQKLPAAVASGLAPDIGLVQDTRIVENAAREVVVPLDELTNRLKLRENAFAGQLWSAGVWRGRRYSIPLDSYPDGVFYNKRVLREAGLDPESPPQTGDEYLDALKALRRGKAYGWYIPATNTTTVGRNFDSLIWQFGGELYSTAGDRATFDSEAGISALTWLVDIIRNDLSPRNGVAGDDGVTFQSNQSAFIWGGPGAYINSLATTKGLEWGAMQTPRVGSKQATYSGSHNLVVLRQRNFDSRKLQAIATFIGWLSENSFQMALAGDIPARRSILREERFTKLEAQSVFGRAAENARLLPQIPGLDDIQTQIVYQAVSDALLLRDTPANLLHRAAEQANELLAQNAQKYGGAQ